MSATETRHHYASDTLTYLCVQSKCLQREGNETSLFSHSHRNSNPLSLPAFGREKQRPFYARPDTEKQECSPSPMLKKTHNQQCVAFSATGGSGRVSKARQACCAQDSGRKGCAKMDLIQSSTHLVEQKKKNPRWLRFTRLSWANDQQFMKDVRWQGSSSILNPIVGEPMVMP